jgi:hypothetical protein
MSSNRMRRLHTKTPSAHSRDEVHQDTKRRSVAFGRQERVQCSAQKLITQRLAPVKKMGTEQDCYDCGCCFRT